MLHDLFFQAMSHHIKEEHSPRAHSINRGYRLYLYNDMIHSFDYVIHMLIKICHHSPLQALQCATITHHRGSCVVKTASRTTLEVMHKSLTDGDLRCEIK